MGRNPVEILVADENTWNQFVRAVGSGWKPPATPGMDTRVPFIHDRQSWASTIADILNQLKPGDVLQQLKIMGHGKSGEITCGVPLRFSDMASIAEFRALKPFCSPAITNLKLIGCEAAAEGQCVPGTIAGVSTFQPLCMGSFTGDIGKPGYLLLKRLADAINAPASGSPWKQAFTDSRSGWEIRGARLTVGPGGGYTYSPAGANGQTATVFGP